MPPAASASASELSARSGRGAGLLQQQGDMCAFVHLGVGSPEHLVLVGESGHALDVALHGIQVYDQRRRVYQVHGLPDGGLC